VASATVSPFLDGAALSPDGKWAVFAVQTEAAPEFNIVRIQVQ